MRNDLELKLRKILAPDPHTDPVDFLEHNVRNIPYSPQSGPFRISNSPWLAEPLLICNRSIKSSMASGCAEMKSKP